MGRYKVLNGHLENKKTTDVQWFFYPQRVFVFCPVIVFLQAFLLLPHWPFCLFWTVGPAYLDLPN